LRISFLTGGVEAGAGCSGRFRGPSGGYAPVEPESTAVLSSKGRVKSEADSRDIVKLRLLKNGVFSTSSEIDGQPLHADIKGVIVDLIKPTLHLQSDQG